MHVGARQKDTRCIELLANHETESVSTDINAQDNVGRTALHICSEKKYFQGAAVLLKRGTYLNVSRQSMSGGLVLYLNYQISFGTGSRA